LSSTANHQNALNSAQVLTVLAKVPTGQVISFGDLAFMSGYSGKARWVGSVLAKLPANTKLPWHRVVNSQGILTCPRADIAAKRLISEGLEIHNFKVSMAKYRWRPGRSPIKTAGSQED